jgi:hypothetical protein
LQLDELVAARGRAPTLCHVATQHEPLVSGSWIWR